VTGLLEAEHSAALAVKLRQSGLLVVDLSEQRAGSPRWRRGRKRVSRRQLTRLYSQLADLLRSGVPMLRSLETLERQYQTGPLAPILAEVRQVVADGEGLAEALARHPAVFPELAVSMIRAGQEGGFLEDVLKRIAQFTQRQEDLRAKVLGAMAYPVFLIGIGFFVLCGLMIFFVPRFEPIFARLTETGNLPTVTVVVLGVSHVLGQFGVFVLLAAVAASMLARRWLRTERGRRLFDTLRLRLPIIGSVQRNLAVVRFSRILGTLLANGISILKALRVAKDSTGNLVLSQAIAEAAENVSSGDLLTKPLRACGLFPADVIEMIAVAEESNTLEEVLLEIADTTEAFATRQMDLAVRLLEPMLLLMMALVTLVVVSGLLLPVFRMSSVI
jgi:general secretion pathway protein F/type IV pilus assembly protein PilC